MRIKYALLFYIVIKRGSTIIYSLYILIKWEYLLVGGGIKNLKYSQIISLIVIFLLSYVFGSILMLYGVKYLSHITIINTFYIFLYIYIVQFIIQSLKVSIIKGKFESYHNLIFKNKILISKFILVNFFYFTLLGIGILGFLLLSLFFSGIKYVFIILMILFVSVLHIIYTLCTLYIGDNSVIKQKLINIKNHRKDLLKLLIINLVIIGILFILMNFIIYFRGIIFAIIVLFDLLLNEIDKIYLYNKFENI